MRGSSRTSLLDRVRALASAALAAGVLVASAGTGQAANFFEKNFWLSGPNWSGQVPACDTPAALSDIQKRFAETESHFWSSSAKIDGFERVHEIAFRPWGSEYQPRRYCEAEAYISGVDVLPGTHAKGVYVGGKVAKAAPIGTVPRKVYYSIIEDGGFQSLTWGVEWCVEGFDRSWTYAPNCRMAKP